DTIPGPLLDRMDVILLSGYTEDEKLGIAKRYLVPKQLEAHGLSKGQIRFGDRMLRIVIREYTREAGVRSLERQIAALCRKAATQVAKGEAKRIALDEAKVREWLGPRRYSGEVRKRTSEPGVATGLAVTAVGGDVLFIEATAYRRHPREGAGGRARGDRDGRAPARERARPRGAARRDAPRAPVRPRRHDRGGPRSRVRRRAPHPASTGGAARAAGRYAGLNDARNATHRLPAPASPRAKRQRSWYSRRPSSTNAIRSTRSLPSRKNETS